MQTPLLQTKLYIPPIRPNLIPRPRLIERLNEGLHRKLTLISAPAGFGKTTLVSDWLHQSKVPAAWLSLDERDNDPTRFLVYLVAALQTITIRQPPAGNLGEGVLAVLQSPQPPPTESILTVLINEITTIPDNLVLVLDDYHVIEAKPVDQALTFLLEHLPPQMHLVITTREDPNLPLARYRVRGQLTELRATDLRFTPAEATGFLNQVMGLKLSTEEIAALETRTEGWIAGLQMAALALQGAPSSMEGRADTTGFIQAFTGSHRFVLDYLVEEVLQRQPEPVRNFLLQTSILDRLSGPLCDAVCSSENAVTGQEDGKGILAAMAHGNLFVIPLDDERRWYRYHHLFADMLQARLMEEQPIQLSTLHQRASVWYEQNGLRADAIHHALAAEDFARAANLVELAWPTMHRSDFRSAELLTWLEAIPDDLIRVRPVLSVGYAWELLNGGQFEAAETRLRDAERWMELTADATADTLTNTMLVMDEAEFRLLPAEIASARAYLALALGDAPSTVRYARQALDFIPEGDHIRRGPAAALLGLAYWTTGELESAHDALAEGMANFQRAGNILFAISGTFGLADIRIAQGRLRAAIGIYEKALQLVVKQGEPALQGTADLHLGLSELYREQNKLAAAEEHLLKSQELDVHPGQQVYQYHWCLVQAQRQQDQGNLDGALRLLDEAEDLFAHIHIPDFRPVAALKTRVRLAHGQLAEAPRWVNERSLSVADDLSFLNEFEYITLARVLIAQYKQARDESTSADSSIHQAMALLTRLLNAAEEGERNGSVIEILILQAMAQAVHDDTSAALVSLQRALILAEPEGYVRVFVDEGTQMAHLLSEAVTRRTMPDYTGKLLAAFEDAAKDERRMSESSSSTVRRPPSLVEPLSERELEVLKLLGTYLNGPEIARELMVSLNTMRTHTKNIYHKLGVNNRQAAVRRAEELDLF